jgi:hypothetical protein
VRPYRASAADNLVLEKTRGVARSQCIRSTESAAILFLDLFPVSVALPFPNPAGREPDVLQGSCQVNMLVVADRSSGKVCRHMVVGAR